MARTLTCCYNLAFLAAVAAIFEAEVLHADELDKEYALAALRHSRSQLNNGQLAVTGTFEKKHAEDDSRSLRHEVTLFIAFDVGAGKHRFDRSIATPQSLLEFKSARIGTSCVIWSNDTHQVTEGLATAKMLDRVRPFDVRALGLLYWTSLEKNEQFETLVDRYNSQPCTRSEVTPSGLTELEWKFDAARRVLWLDQKSGYSPVRMEVRYKRADGTWGEPAQLSDVTWEKRGGTFVPKQCRMVSIARPWTQECNFSFEWHSVNQPLADVVFTKEGFSLKSATPVVNVESKVPILVGSVGGTGPPPGSASGTGQVGTIMKRYLPFIVIAFAVIAAAVWWRRSLRK